MQVAKQLWSVSSSEALSILESSNLGLTKEEARDRLSKYGTNTFHSKERTRFVLLFLKQFVSPLIFLLIGAATLTAILHSLLDTAVIAFAILLNVSLGFFHEYHAENTLSKLNTYIKDRTRVIRDGHEEEIDSSLLVPGDVIRLAYGSRVSADARILSVSNFHVDEAILTGESTPVEKKEAPIHATLPVAERKNVAHAGSLVVEGYATAVVFATGNQTEIGRIAGVVSKIKRAKTPLQAGVWRLAWMIFFIALLIVAGIFFLGISRGEPVLSMLVLSAAVAVGAVPEALPISLTVILAIGAERIAKKKGIVRKLAAAETLGSVTVIMTDKTGTLTLADMQLVGVHTIGSLLSSSESHSLKNFSQDEKNLLGMSLSNVDVTVENPSEEESKWTFRGRPFEVNIVRACRAHGLSLAPVRSGSSELVLPFNSTNKFSVAGKDGEYVVMGAPDILLKRSNISKEEYLKINSWIETTSREGKRIIGVAALSKKESKKNRKNILPEEVAGLSFLGVFVFYDPIRPEVPGAIKNIESHNVKMILVTGDLVGTALSVAKSLDWRVDESEVLSGSDLASLSDPELSALIPKTKIFARVTPEDKLRIGRLLRAEGEVVAMTGDGVNDAPALKAMDIGVSLGTGSDVAKAASDLVLLDDNFKTISHAIDEGRRIISNIRKSFVYLMSNSLDEVFIIGGSLIFGLSFPLTALQIIWVNLFTGSLPAIAFAFDEIVDKEKREGKKLGLIFSREVKALTFGVGVVSSTLLFFLYLFLIKMELPLPLIKSIFFVCFSSYILFIAFSFRSLHRSIFSYAAFGNKMLNIGVAAGVLILLVTMIMPAARNIFGIAPLPLSWIPFIILWIALNVILVETTKYLLRKASHFLPKLFAQSK